MNLKYLLQFYELSQYENMSTYARAAGVTSAQVTRMVNELEKEFDTLLLIRQKNRASIEFTEKGKILLARIPILFNEIKNTKTLVQSDPQKEKGVFSLFTTHFLIDYLLAPNLIKLKNKTPEITVNLYGTENQISNKDKKYSLSISPYSEELEGITQIELASFHVGLWASEKYIKHFGMPAHHSELKRHNFICFEEEWPEQSYPTVNWYLDNALFELQNDNIQIIRSSTGIMKAAHTGLGIFSVSKESLDLLGLEFTPILPNLEGPCVKMCLTYPNEWKQYKAVQEIQNFLVTLFQENVQKK